MILIQHEELVSIEEGVLTIVAEAKSARASEWFTQAETWASLKSCRSTGVDHFHRRALIIMVAIAVASIAVAIALVDPFWEWISTEKRFFDGRSFQGVVLISGMRMQAANHRYRGWERVKRWGKYAGQTHGPAMAWYVENGQKAVESHRRDGEPIAETRWHYYGSIDQQISRDARTSPQIGQQYSPESGDPSYGSWLIDKKTNTIAGEHRQSPPWWWGASDQTEPTAPWWNDGP